MLALSRYRAISGVNKVINGQADGASYPISPAGAQKLWKR